MCFMEVSDLNQNMLILGKFVADIRDSKFSKKCSVREWWFFDEDGVLRHETFGPIDFYGTANKSDRDSAKIRDIDREIRIIKGDISEKIRTRIFRNWTDEEFQLVKGYVDGIWIYKKATYNNVHTIDEMVQCVDRNKHIIICRHTSHGDVRRANVKTLDELIHGKYHEIRFISDSCDDNVFDALVLSLPLIQGNNTKKEMLNMVEENIQSVKKRVVRILNRDKDYKKYGVPVNLLTITKILITRDNMLEISLELKKV